MEFVKQMRGLGLLGLLAVGCSAPDEPIGKTSAVVLAQNVGGTANCAAGGAGPATPFTREQRLSRFTYFLTKRKEAFLLQGATRQSERPERAGWYSQTSLLDPRAVHDPSNYAINRYDSYLKRISDQMVSENLVQRSVSFNVLTPPPQGFKRPEDFGPVEVDATAALRQALDCGNVWLTPKKIYVLTGIIDIPSTRQIISDGSGTLLFKTGAEPFDDKGKDDDGEYRDEEVRPIRIVGASNVVLRDFRVGMASEENDAQPLLRGGIQVTESSNVSIQGLELLGFPRTQGIIVLNSATSVSIEDNLFHGGYTKVPARQVTGIDVDSDREQVDSACVSDDSKKCPQQNSDNLRIVGNFILGVMMDKTVVDDTSFPDRDGAALGYETDGINLAGNANPHLVANNSIMDVGEGIDTYSSNGQYRNNHIERAFALGVKVVHGASGNLFSGNRVLATGLSSIFIQHTDLEPAGSNAFIKNRIRYTNAFNVAQFTPPIPVHHGIAAIHLDGYTKSNAFQMNEITNPMYSGSALWKGGIFCEWKPPTAASNANRSWKDRFDGFGDLVFDTTMNGECLTTNTDAPLLASTRYELWTAAGVRVESNVRPDVFGEQTTVDRIWSDIPGQNEVRTSVALGSGQDRNFTFSVLARRGTSSKLILRDQISNWLVTFELTGEGRVESKSATVSDMPPGPILSASIVPLTDDWYLLRVTFSAPGANALLTLRQPSWGPGLFLDLGEARLDLAGVGF